MSDKNQTLADVAHNVAMNLAKQASSAAQSGDNAAAADLRQKSDTASVFESNLRLGKEEKREQQ